MKREIINFECPKCGCKQSYRDVTIYFDAGECVSCGELTYYKKIRDMPNQHSVSVKCPYCHSTNTKKISNISKVGNAFLFGVFAAGKVSKEWHCNNCKSDF